MRQLMERHADALFGAIYPLVATGDADDKRLANEALQEGLVARELTGADPLPSPLHFVIRFCGIR